MTYLSKEKLDEILDQIEFPYYGDSDIDLWNDPFSVTGS